MIKTISIFVTTIINKNVFIFFTFDRPEYFAIEVKNYRLNYFQNNSENKNPISINHTSLWPNNLVQTMDNFVISYQNINLLDKIETNNIYRYNVSF